MNETLGTHDEPTPLGCDPADLARVEAIVRQAGTSFATGMRILPPYRRYGMYAIYAFCRIVDDIADGDAPSLRGAEHAKDREARLNEWHARIARLYEGQTHDALDRVLHAAIRFFSLHKHDFDAIIDGMTMDALGPIVAPDEETLDLYCDRVAAAVGRLSVHIFGDSSHDAKRVAHHLGRALQLTNILRDVGEDAHAGRLYLPRDLLARFDVPADPQKILSSAGLPGVLQIISVRARDHFREAFRIMKKCDRRAMMPARLMGGCYLGILDSLEKRGWDHAGSAMDVSPARKAVGVLQAFAA
ncbi:phytoene synthase [Acetobacter estunensis NRIC 0472]|uniref:Presqualene diphosphate synthase HpnD n=1 Tax=Acetobacter estunensis TaxID=104097 RepID=A0A967B311_9PROT|nr:presqualene diphosphate synthase HpnD [Acetobacter estunensis]MBV1837441.1 presqualene diphosphate synthase HpnD [Acetobacter estunensis]NHO52797.1 presqualene diphosphate synthase HpnD [Acetobacter estunensis]GBQ28264.1 phytoene synthase [Acetobacter estunensis NRIC 0472]